MDVHTTTTVDHATRMTQDTDNLLQLFHFSVFQLGGIEFDFIEIVYLNGRAFVTAKFCNDASIINELPLLAVRVVDMVSIITAIMVVAGMKMLGQRLRSLLAGQPGHFYLTAKVLIFEIKGQSAHPAVLHP